MGERGFPEAFLTPRFRGLGWPGKLGSGVLVWVPPEAASMSGFECNLFVLEEQEMPAAGLWGSETGKAWRCGGNLWKSVWSTAARGCWEGALMPPHSWPGACWPVGATGQRNGAAVGGQVGPEAARREPLQGFWRVLLFRRGSSLGFPGHLCIGVQPIRPSARPHAISLAPILGPRPEWHADGT